MLQVWATSAPDDAAAARLERLAGEIVIVSWDGGGDAGPVRPKLDGALAPRPYLMLAVPLRGGGARHVAVLCWPGQGGGRFHAEAGDRSIAAAVWAAGRELPGLDGNALMAGLDPAGRRRLVRGLFAHLAGIGSRMPDAADAARHLMAALWPDRTMLRAVGRATARHRLLEGKGDIRLGSLGDTFLLSAGGLKAVRDAAASTSGREARRTIAVLPDAAEATDVLFLGMTGLAAFRIEPAAGRTLPPLLAWAERHKDKAGRTDQLMRLLQELAGRSAEAAAALRELQVLTPRATGRIGLDAAGLQAMIDVAVADGHGVLVSGWMNDPQRLVAGLALDRTDALPRRFADRFHRFPRRLRKGDGKEAGSRLVEGFVAYLSAAPEAQHRLHHRFHLLLHSGGSIPLAAPAQSADPIAARAAVLGSLQPEAVTPAILAGCLAPAVGALHRRCLGIARDVETVTLGTPPAEPAFSVIVPLYRNLEFLKFQIAAFAVDPDRHCSEYIYVLDSPEQRSELEHLLRGLYRLHGLPLRLLINPVNLGYAAANNAAAAVARGRTLAMVNSDVLPVVSGWLAALDSRLAARPQLGAVGPKLLFEDESLQHAGMFFARDLNGRWLNHHYYKGLPRFFPPAQIERSVPALTGACLVVRRHAYAAVGGFTEDYVIGDYEDSDLCLKLRRDGYDLAYVPAVELYHLERRSIRHHAGYMKGVACLYNAWLHAQRWQAEMAWLADGNDTPVRARIGAAPEIVAPVDPAQPIEVAAE